MAKKSPKRPYDIFALCAVLDEVRQAIDTLKVSPEHHVALTTIARLIDLEPFTQLLAHRRYAGHEQHLRFLRSSLDRKRYEKALGHMMRLRKIVTPCSNDHPLAKGDLVWVNRTEHGWDVGMARVSEVYGSPPDNVSYEVVMEEDPEWGPHFIAHTRDLSRQR